MNILDAIKTRRSIRKYTSALISKENVEKILEAGLYAPTTRNLQARRFIVFQGIESIAKLNRILKDATMNSNIDYERQYIDMVSKPAFTINYGAPLFILIANKKDDRNPNEDCAVAAQNMMLAAHGLGIGSVWINQFKYVSDTKEIREMLNKNNVPENYNIYNAVAFGYSAVDNPKAYPRVDGQIIYADI